MKSYSDVGSYIQKCGVMAPWEIEMLCFFFNKLILQFFSYACIFVAYLSHIGRKNRNSIIITENSRGKENYCYSVTTNSLPSRNWACCSIACKRSLSSAFSAESPVVSLWKKRTAVRRELYYLANSSQTKKSKNFIDMILLFLQRPITVQY